MNKSGKAALHTNAARDVPQRTHVSLPTETKTNNTIKLVNNNTKKTTTANVIGNTNISNSVNSSIKQSVNGVSSATNPSALPAAFSSAINHHSSYGNNINSNNFTGNDNTGYTVNKTITINNNNSSNIKKNDINTESSHLPSNSISLNGDENMRERIDVQLYQIEQKLSLMHHDLKKLESSTAEATLRLLQANVPLFSGQTDQGNQTVNRHAGNSPIAMFSTKPEKTSEAHVLPADENNVASSNTNVTSSITRLAPVVQSQLAQTTPHNVLRLNNCNSSNNNNNNNPSGNLSPGVENNVKGFIAKRHLSPISTTAIFPDKTRESEKIKETKPAAATLSPTPPSHTQGVIQTVKTGRERGLVGNVPQPTSNDRAKSEPNKQQAKPTFTALGLENKTSTSSSSKINADDPKMLILPKELESVILDSPSGGSSNSSSRSSSSSSSRSDGDNNNRGNMYNYGKMTSINNNNSKNGTHSTDKTNNSSTHNTSKSATNANNKNSNTDKENKDGKGKQGIGFHTDKNGKNNNQTERSNATRKAQFIDDTSALESQQHEGNDNNTNVNNGTSDKNPAVVAFREFVKDDKPFASLTTSGEQRLLNAKRQVLNEDNDNTLGDDISEQQNQSKQPVPPHTRGVAFVNMEEDNSAKNVNTAEVREGGNQKLETSAIMANSMLRSTLVTDGKYENSITTNASAGKVAETKMDEAGLTRVSFLATDEIKEIVTSHFTPNTANLITTSMKTEGKKDHFGSSSSSSNSSSSISDSNTLHIAGRGGNAGPSRENAKAVDGLSVVERQQQMAAKQSRESFFAKIPRLSEIIECDQQNDRAYMNELLLPGAPCSWLWCIALTLSYVMKDKISIEEVLAVNRMSLHNISLPTVTLAQEFDITMDYIINRCNDLEAAKNALLENKTIAHSMIFGSVPLNNLNEINHTLTKLSNVNCEMATFDTDILEPIESEEEEALLHEVGEHAPIASLPEFRKELNNHINEPNSMYIFNFNPYTVEQYELRMRSNMAETEEEAEAIMSSARYQPDNRGKYAILIDFSPVLHTVKIATPEMTRIKYPLRSDEVMEHELHLRPTEAAPTGSLTTHPGKLNESSTKNTTGSSGGGNENHNVNNNSSKDNNTHVEQETSEIVLEVHTINLQTFYESVKQVDGYTGLSRGFVRIFQGKQLNSLVPSIFPLFVLDGSSSGGLITSTLDVTIAPHILGLAMVHHLAITFLLSDSARRKQSSRNLLSKANVCDVKLRGIPLTKICQQLRLPLSTIVSESAKTSLATAFVWYNVFLRQLQIHHEVYTGLVLPERREGASDGQPNIPEEDFLAHLQLVVKTESIMLISFNVNIALNVNIRNVTEPAHCAIVIGLDATRNMVRLADVNVKRFRKTWHLPLSRLYNATMGYGYMIAAKEKKIIKQLNCKSFQEAALNCAKYFLPPSTNAIMRFEYPARPYAITVLADAVERLGFSADVEKFLNFSGFHISYFMSKHMPLEGAAAVLQNYSHYALDDALMVQTTHYDYHEDHLPENESDVNELVNPLHRVRTEEDLLNAIEFALASPETRKLIVKFDHEVIVSCENVWNGSNGGHFAMVCEYDAHNKTVILMDANVSAFYRTFACPLFLLFKAICSFDPEDLRARGTLLLSRDMPQDGMYENTRGYDLAHALVHHPFRPIFSATCSCIALAATEMMMNIAMPQMLGGISLDTREDERKKYKRYNNIFSAEDILYTLSHFNVYEWQTESTGIQNVAEMANRAFKTLNLPLTAVDILATHPESLSTPWSLLSACNGMSGLVTIVLIAYDTDIIHGIPGCSMGLVNRVDDMEGKDESCSFSTSFNTDNNNNPNYNKSVPGDNRRRRKSSRINTLGNIQLVEGDPCRWGTYVERTAHEFLPAVRSIISIEAAEDT